MSSIKTLTSAVSVGALLAGLATLAFADPAKPAPPPGGKRPGPPAAAFTACEQRREGDACSFQGRDRQVAGTCAKPPRRDQLVCRPPNGPRPPEGGDDKQDGGK